MIPVHILEKIFHYVDYNNLLKIREVSKVINKKIEDQILERRPSQIHIESFCLAKCSAAPNDILFWIFIRASSLSSKAIILIAIKRTKVQGITFRKGCDRKSITFEKNSNENVLKFLSGLKPYLTELIVEDIELSAKYPEFMKAGLDFLDGATIEEAYLYESTNLSIDLVFQFMSKVKSQCIQFHRFDVEIPKMCDLLKKAAITNKCIDVSTVAPLIIEKPLPLVLDILQRNCTMLDLACALSITKSDIELIVQNILAMEKVVYFAAAIKDEEDDMNAFYGPIRVIINDDGPVMIKVVEILHEDIQSSYLDHAHRDDN